MGRKRGRPTLFNPQLAERIVMTLRTGASLKDACDFVGISYFTLNEWVKDVELFGTPDGIGRPKPTPQLVNFVKSLRVAQTEVKILAINSIREAMSKDWRAAESLLKRRYRSEWGDSTNDKMTITGANDGPVAIEDLSPMTDEQRLKRFDELIAIAKSRKSDDQGTE